MKSSVNISVVLNGSKSCLQHSYFTAPFKLANITADKNARMLDLMLMCSSPGILDNDEYQIEIEVKAGASLQLHTQSYQRLFKMKNGASQQMNIRVKEGAVFMYLPHPAVPHAASVFTAVNQVFLSANATLLWGEIITCGRQLNNESFSFSKYHNLTQIFLNDKLVIRENLLMQPGINSLHLIGLLEGYTHQASLIWLCNDPLAEEKKAQALQYLSEQNNLEFGISKAPVNGFIVRILGYKAEQLHECLKKIGNIVMVKEEVIH